MISASSASESRTGSGANIVQNCQNPSGMMYGSKDPTAARRSGHSGKTQIVVAPIGKHRNREISTRRAVHRQSMAPPFTSVRGGPDFRKTGPKRQFVLAAAQG